MKGVAELPIREQRDEVKSREESSSEVRAAAEVRAAQR
jgi:hypothetical protein